MYSRSPRRTFWREWATSVDHKNFSKGTKSQVVLSAVRRADVHCTAKFKYVHLTNPVSQTRKFRGKSGTVLTQGTVFILGYQSCVNRYDVTTEIELLHKMNRSTSPALSYVLV